MRRADHPATRRLSALLALAAIAVVHLRDAPGSLGEVPYVGALELALAGACLLLMFVVCLHDARITWGVAVALMLAAALSYVASRTTGLPGAGDDVGNWGSAMGTVSLLAEIALLLLGADTLRRRPRSSVDRAPLS
jgi:hypothetical protein